MRLFIPALAAFILTGCASEGGFSTGGLPPRLPPALYNVYVESMENDSPFQQAMRQEFMAQGVRVSELRTETNTIFRISREGVERRAGAAGSGQNSAREYQLIYTATYVVTVDGKELFMPETVNTYRNYTANSSSSGGGDMMRSAEESSIVDNLARDMARQAMRKLTSLR